MKSPFPGMDPYLERHWEDVHTALIGYVRDELQPQLSEDLIARMEEKVYVEDDTEIRKRKPDVRVVESPVPWQPETGMSSTALLDEPMLLDPLDDPIRERSVLIYDSVGQRIITAIEILSPWNKSPGNAVREYLKKRQKYVNIDMNLVEIDLIRAGDWTRMIGPYELPEAAIATYRVTIARPDIPQLVHYPISIRSRLPTIEVPLRLHETPAKLDLQGLIEKAYRMGRYNRIDYSEPCSPPFEGPEKQWAESVIKAAN